MKHGDFVEFHATSRGIRTDVSNREWPQYYDAEIDCIIRTRRTRPNVTTATNTDFHKVIAHSRRLLEFASEVAFSEDIPAHNITVQVTMLEARFVEVGVGNMPTSCPGDRVEY
jgi:hypothetical protein